MSTILTILEFVIFLGVLAALHELGHFISAKWVGIPIEEFGLGLPPRIVRLFRIGSTDYTLNWIPFGAFVRPKGENDPNVEGGMASASPWRRLLFFSGGPLMNLIIAILLYTIIFSQTGAPDTTKVMIYQVNENSPAQTAGIQPNDIIIGINNNKINSSDQLRTIVSNSLGKSITLTILRGSQTINVDLVPRVNPPQDQGAMGVVLTNPVIQLNFFQALPYACVNTFDLVKSIVTSPFKALAGQIPADQLRLVSPVGLYDIFSQVRTQEIPNETNNPQLAILNIMNFFAFISIALAITNLLPFPGLDGGHIIFVLPELIFHKRVPAKYENMIQAIGLTLLLVLMAVLFVQDFVNPVILR